MPGQGELRVGLAGRRGRSFIAGLRSCPEVHVAAFCEIRPDRLESIADEHGIPERYSSFEAMIESDLDAIVVATPMHLHVPQSVAALERGKHVLSEVTAAVSLDECPRLVEAVRRSGRTYMMGENYGYIRQNMVVREMVRAGLFGDIYYAEGAYIHDCRLVQYQDGEPTWRTVWQVGKNGCTYGTHSLGPLLEWFGERVATVSCLGSGVHTEPAHTLEDSVIMLCKTESGALLNVRVDMQSHRPLNATHYVLQGTKGAYHSARRAGEPDLIWIEGRSREREAWQSLEEYADEFTPPAWREWGAQASRAGHGGSDFFVARDFITSILNDTTPPIDVYRALDYTVPGLVSEESIARGGIPLPVPNFRSL